MYNRNAAYDFGNLDEQKRGKVVRLPKRRSKLNEKLKTKKRILVSLFSAFLVSAIGVSAFIMGQVKLTEVTDKVGRASKELEECESLNMQLSMKAEAQNSDKAFGSICDTGVEATQIVKIPKEAISEVH